MTVVIGNVGARPPVVSGDTDTGTGSQKSLHHHHMTRFTRLETTQERSTASHKTQK
jgi:hypothetical protein